MALVVLGLIRDFRGMGVCACYAVMPLYLNPNRVFVVEGVPLSERLDPSVYIGSTLGSFLLFACLLNKEACRRRNI
jgi:hypothetical protein